MKPTQTKKVETLHNQDCKMVFGRKDPSCPRCVELINGATARKGWQADYYGNKKLEDERRSKEIKEHDCTKAGCVSICTFGDW